MLLRLSIRDLVVVDSMALEFGPGLCALTGETGAGKSILIDGLGLALGRRADAGMVRAGAARATVAAVFSLADAKPAAAWLADRGFDDGGEVILRRSIGADGRSRAFVNDRPATVSALVALGRRLLEIHGQDTRLGLLDPARHRAALDGFGGLGREAARVAQIHARRRAVEAELADAEARHEQDAADQGLLQSELDELTALAVAPGEEARLADERKSLMAGERAAEALAAASAALGGDPAPDHALATAARALHRAVPHAAGRLDDLAAALDRAVVEAAEARAGLDAAVAGMDIDRDHLEAVEARLFALRAVARKHRVAAERLPEIAESLAARLAAIETGARSLDSLREAVGAARADYDAAAAELSAGRRRAARALAATIDRELAALRLAGARFSVSLSALDENERGAGGAERVGFRISTNAGATGALQRIASGGELSRFMLALCVALAGKQATPSLVFDEIDVGVGGAVAHAVGTRLARLAACAQVLVVTHHPQVAALAAHHYRIVKQTDRGRAATVAEPLSAEARREEIARMLSGAEITGEARAAADSLLAAAGAA